MTARRAQTTVYADNNRAGTAGRVAEPGWHAAIAALVERDYAFLPLGYDAPGYLFRGIDGGLGELLAGQPALANRGDHTLAALERDSGVLFVSQDRSDALAVSRLWEDPREAAILVIPAAAFAAAQARGAAAVLGFADPGVVFRYPCFAPPLAAEHVSLVVVHPARLAEFAGATAAAVHAPAVPGEADRAAFERALGDLLDGLGCTAAAPIPSRRVPRRAAPS